MGKMARLTVRLPSDLLAAVDHDLAQVDESRSAVVRRLLAEALRQARETKADDAYVRAYHEFPQTEEGVIGFGLLA